MKLLIAYKDKGFTLIEILVVIGIITLILVVGAFADLGSFGRELLATERTNLVSILSKARSRSMNNVGQVEHGVRIDADKYVLLPENEEIERNENININMSDIGGDEIFFEQLSGNTENDGNIVLTSGTRSYTINITEAGLIDW